MSHHPAYPTRADLRREREADERTAEVLGANAMVADILAGALAKLRAMRLDDIECMSRYGEWEDIMGVLSDMIPAVDDPKMRRAVADKAREAVE